MTCAGPSLARSARRLALAVSLALSSPFAAMLLGAAIPAATRADDAWKDEFAEVCSKTQDAMALSDAELRALVARCDKLKTIVDALDEPHRKVYARRLQACRELYQFVLDSRTAAPSAAPGASR